MTKTCLEQQIYELEEKEIKSKHPIQRQNAARLKIQFLIMLRRLLEENHQELKEANKICIPEDGTGI